jgi:hypothetical protein
MRMEENSPNYGSRQGRKLTGTRILFNTPQQPSGRKPDLETALKWLFSGIQEVSPPSAYSG